MASVDELIAGGGLAALTLERVADATSLSPTQIQGRYPNVEALVFSSALRLAADPVIEWSTPTDEGPMTVAATTARLADLHRRYVAERPNRFAVLHELGCAALFDFPSLQRPLADRNRRTCAVAHERLAAAWDIDHGADVGASARVLVGAFNGIELCFLDDGDAAARDAAYDEAALAVARHLSRAL